MEVTADEIREARKDGIRLWVRHGGRAKAIQVGREPRGDGHVVLVRGARDADEARFLHEEALRWRAMSTADQDDMEEIDPHTWLRMRRGDRNVTEEDPKAVRAKTLKARKAEAKTNG